MTDDQKMTKGEYLWAMFETWIIIFPPIPRMPHFAVARVLSRGMWGMRGMFLAGISVGGTKQQQSQE